MKWPTHVVGREAVAARRSAIFSRWNLVLVTVAFGASAQADPRHSPEAGLTGEPGGDSQVLTVTKYGRDEIPGEFVLYRSGLILFRTAAHAGEGLGWFQVRLNPKEKAAFARLIQGREFGALRAQYDVPNTNDVGSYLICGVQENGHTIEVSVRGSPKSDKVPAVLTRLFSLLKDVDAGQAEHWQPEWIDLGVEHESPFFPGPGRELPREWLTGSTRPEPYKIRVSGRYEAAVHEFLIERQQAGGPALLDGDTVGVSASAVLPGKEACPQWTVRIGAVPAKREPGERPPAR
jgi:hypothetical protein